MTPERWHRAREVLAVAIEHGTATDDVLHNACGGDAELERTVRQMLDADAATVAECAADDATYTYTSSSPQAQQPPPEFLGTERFSILRRIGAGATGVVYEALDRQRNERVALKRLSRAEPFLIYRFKQEFRSLSEIVHPNILQLYEFFSDAGNWFFTMELVQDPVSLLEYVRPGSPTESSDGSDLTSSRTETLIVPRTEAAAKPGCNDAAQLRIVRGPPDWGRFYDTFRQLAEGVAALHHYHKLHRDLKPGNVLVRGDGRVVLLDFGLVADLTRTASDELTLGTAPASPSPQVYYMTDQMLAGTISYMSPEQANALPLTPASDWYSVGAILFQALTGRLPFEGSREIVLYNKRRFEPAAPSVCVDGIPADLDRLCWQLLRHDPEARPSGKEVLAHFSSSSSATVRPVEPAGDIPFVGRQSQLDTLSQAFASAAAGRPVICYVRGASGAGKSALVERFLAGLGRNPDALALSGRCYERESVPYKAVDSLVDMLCMRLARQPTEQVKSWTPGDVSVLVRIFPVLQRVFPSPPEGEGSGVLGLRELHGRAVAALSELLARVSERYTLVLAIDDLQWGDLDSASLLANLLRAPRLARLMLVTAYRSEYDQVSPCIRRFREAEASEGAHQRMEIEVTALSEAEARELASKLLGDALPQGAVVADRIVRESQGSAFFVYELVRHARAGIDVSSARGLELDDILWKRAGTLPDEARRLLEVIAVAGRPIPIQDACAAAAVGGSPHQLIPQLRAGHFIREFGLTSDQQVETYHDRVRETVSSHLSDSQRKGYHGRLAAVLEAGGRAEPETLGAHYQAAGDPRACRYFELAAARAVERLAFNRAEEYFRNAAALAPSDLDRARIYEKMIHFYTDVARFGEAYTVGRRALEMFGIKLPLKFNPAALLLDCAWARLRIGRRSVAEILDFREMQDEGLRSAVRLISAMAKAAYQVQPELCVAVSTKAVNLCLRHGNTEDVAVVYMVFGCIFLGGVLGRHRTGFEFGRLALRLVEKYNNRKQYAEVHFVVGYFATSWLQPATEAEQLWRVAYQAGLETNDLFHTGCACAGTIQSLFMRGVPLERVWDESERLLEFLTRSQLHEPIGCLTSVRQSIRNLQGRTRSHTALSDATFSEEAFAAEVEKFGSRHFAHFYFINKMQVLYLWGEYDAARKMAERSAQYQKDSRGMLHSAEHILYSALIAAALLTEGRPPAGARRELARARKLFAGWASRCPDNFEHKHRLLGAEEARVRGKHAAAARLYDEAVAAASQFGYWQVHALANQLAARLQQRLGDAARARTYMAAAEESWRRWGATALAAQAQL